MAYAAPLPRRDFLKVGGLALGGLSLPRILEAQEATRPDTSVILLYLAGGPSHLETYDLKPDAPIEYRSVFRPIPTVVPGLDLCELLPRHAQLADRFSLVRSMNHEVPIHNDGGTVVLTGRQNTILDPTSVSTSEHPDFGHVASRLRGLGPGALPPYVGIPSGPGMTRPNYVGPQCAPFACGDPSNSNYRPPQIVIGAPRDAARFDDRRTLLNRLDRLRAGMDLAGQIDTGDRFREQAFQMLASPRLVEAFDIAREDPQLRDRYGRNLWGQGCLLARRLAEAGAAVVTLNINTPKVGQEFTNWDDHILNAGRPGHFADYMRVRLPYFDQALATLIEDVFARGLDRRILIIVTGEFGRTPRLSHNVNGTGRDHWPQAYSVLVSGGGLSMGRVIGRTNSKAEFPAERPCSPQDLLATIYRHLGIDIGHTFRDLAGRPLPILDRGRPISELVG